MGKKQISPSMMCVDFMNVKGDLATMEKHGIEYLHIDIMDGEFVNNYTLGTDFCKVMKKNSSIPLDIHLMIEKPERYIDDYIKAGADIICFHYEATEKADEIIEYVSRYFTLKTGDLIFTGTPAGVSFCICRAALHPGRAADAAV